MSLFTPGLTQATDNNGNPLSGAKWWFYLTGTTTAAAVNDASGASLGSSITADSAGWFAPAYLDDSVIYRAILKTAAGATLGQYDIDPVNSSSSGGVTGFVTPEQFGAVGDEVADDGAALNEWLAYIAENKVPFAALTGNYRTTIPIAYDFNYGDGGYTTDKLYTSTIYCHARIRGDGTMDHLMEIKKAPHLKFVGNLHLMGKVDGGGDPWSTRTINVGLYYESCGHMDVDFIHTSGFAIYGVETGGSGTNDNLSTFGHVAASRVGSGPRDGDAVRGQRTTFSARSDSGSANSFDQRSTLTVAALHPVYMDGNQRCTEIRIGGTGILYTIMEVNRGASTISVYPWIEGGVTAGDIEYYFGAAFCARGTDANLINIGSLGAQICGGALDLQCLYGGTYGTVHCEGSGVALRIGRDPSSTILGASIGRLYCEGTTKDIRLNSASAANIVIDSASPIDWAKVESGAAVRDGAFTLGSQAFAGVSIGSDEGGAYLAQKRAGTTVELDFNKVRADRQYIGAALTLNLVNPSADLARLFLMDAGLVTCRDATSGGGCTSVTFAAGSGYTVNGGATAVFGPFTEPMQFSATYSGTNWLINPIGLKLNGSATYNAPSVAAGGQTSTTVTVTGAVVGDLVTAVSFGVSTAGLIPTAQVTAANTVTIWLDNNTAGAIDLASTTVKVRVEKA